MDSVAWALTREAVEFVLVELDVLFTLSLEHSLWVKVLAPLSGLGLVVVVDGACDAIARDLSSAR